MHPMEGFPRLVALLWVCLTAHAAELTVTPLTAISPPELTRFSAERCASPSVAVSGTNAIFVWHRGSGRSPGEAETNSSRTNIFLTRLDPAGNPIDAPPIFVAPAYNMTSQPRLVASQAGFFMLYSVRTNVAGPTAYLLTHITPEGKRRFSPIVLETNTFKYSAAAGNGRSLLFVGGTPSRQPGLKYRLIGEEGSVTSGTITNASQETAAVASDGTDYMVVWRLNASELRATRIFANGQQAPSTAITNAFTFTPSIAYGRDGYLVIGGARLVLLAPDGKELRRGTNTMPTSAVTVALYPEGGDWIQFHSPSATSVRTVYARRINGSTFSIASNAYPTAEGVGSIVENAVIPFGTARYLVARSSGTSILTKAGVTPPVPPISYVPQAGNRIAASPFGYIAVWQEWDARTYTIVMLRMAKDGTPLDAEPLRVEGNSPVTSFDCVFDGEDYVVGWIESESALVSTIARVAPVGAPDVRERTVSLLPDSAGFTLVATRTGVYAWQRVGASGAAELHIYPVLASGEVGPAIVVTGESLGSDGERLFAVSWNAGQVNVAAIDPAAATPEGPRTQVGAGSQPYAVSGPRGMLVSWDGTAAAHYAYFTNGVKQFEGTTLLRREFALSADRILVVAEPNATRGRYVFTMVDPASGASASANADFGTIRSMDIASAGEDFLGVADALGLQMNYAGKFWVTSAGVPMFGAARVSEAGVTASLTLNPGRRYRIETSDDLLHWEVADVVSGEASYDVTSAGEMQEFVRAILVPE